jgi:hypothetical protein
LAHVDAERVGKVFGLEVGRCKHSETIVPQVAVRGNRGWG